MKKTFLSLILVIAAISGFSQQRIGDFYKIQVRDMLYSNGYKLIYPSDTVGQFHYDNMRDPSEPLDGVNLRTLFARMASFDSLGLLVSDVVSGNQVINAGETQIFFPSAFDSNNVTVVPYVRRISDDAVIDYTINDVDSLGFDIVVWEDNIKISYIASQKITHSSDIFNEPIYSKDSTFIKQTLLSYITDSVNYIWFKDSTSSSGYTSRLRHSNDLAKKQNLLINSSGLASALSDETGTGLAVFNTNPTFTSAFNTTVDDITVTNKNKYRPLLSYNGTVIARFQDYYWNGSAYAANNSFGFGSSSLTNNSGANASGFGAYSLQNNSGANSCGFGGFSLRYNSVTYSSGFGFSSLENNSGAYSSGFGAYSLQNNSGANSCGFGYLSLRYNSGVNSSGFGYYSLTNNSGAYSCGFGAYSLYNNNWANVIAVGAQSTNFFLDNSATDKTFDETCINATNKTITFPAPHGFGATNAKVNLRFTTLTGTAPGGLTTNTVYRFTITSATVLTYSAITSIGSEDFTGKLTNSVDINNSIAIGNNVNASKANQVVIGKSTITETQLFGKIGINSTAPDKQVEINSTTGAALRTTYNDADGSSVNFVDYSVTSSGDAAISPSGGDIYINAEITKGIENSKVSGVIFTQIADKNVSNTTTETTLIGTGIGSVSLPANMLVQGKTVRCRLHGYLSANNGVNATINIKIGAVTLVTSTSAMPKSLSNVGWEATFDLTCRTTGETGTIMGQGGTIIYDGQAITTNYTRNLLMTAQATVNTTVENAINITYTWGTADVGNSITSTNFTIEILN